MGRVRWGGVGNTVAYSVRDRDTSASCTDPSTYSRVSRDDEREGLVEGSVASVAEISEVYWKNLTFCLDSANQYIFFVINGV